jgi:hypothetical protein
MTRIPSGIELPESDGKDANCISQDEAMGLSNLGETQCFLHQWFWKIISGTFIIMKQKSLFAKLTFGKSF